MAAPLGHGRAMGGPLYKSITAELERNLSITDTYTPCTSIVILVYSFKVQFGTRFDVLNIEVSLI